jgi:shikimate kinase
MRRILVTGMSGTGKSTVLAELAKRGYATVETDVEPWSEWSDEAAGYVWNEALVAELLEREHETALFVAGTVSNQGRLYDRFDAVVLLSAPAEVLLERIASRTTNPFGKSPEERGRILADLAEVEPLLRASCTHELDATRPVEVVVAELVAIGEGVRRG